MNDTKLTKVIMEKDSKGRWTCTRIRGESGEKASGLTIDEALEFVEVFLMCEREGVYDVKREE